MKYPTLILDLDNTIFHTRSMDPELLRPFFDDLVMHLEPRYGAALTSQIVHELWEKTFDLVIRQYNIPQHLFLGSLRKLNDLNCDLNIKHFDDYTFIKQWPGLKFLVTTGPQGFQQLKIKCLGIVNDFTKIVINDPFRESRTKKDVFEELVTDYKLIPKATWVVGDNSDSELAAANALGMTSVQILRKGVVKGNNASHYIVSFEELFSVMRM